MTSTAAVPADDAMAWFARWECAAGTVQGRDHYIARRNNQDAIECVATPEACVAVLADGCGSAPHSETGARLLASLLARVLARRVAAAAPTDADWPLDAALEEVLAALSVVATLGEGEPPAWLARHLLATVLAVLVTPARAVVFRIGDGIVGVNGTFVTHEAPGNAPGYAAYRLVPPSSLAPAHRGAALVVEWEGPSEELRDVTLATDGAAQLLALPGDPYATLREWHVDDALFDRPMALGRRLVQLARDSQAIDWEAQVVRRCAGVLRDDTTVFLLRRCRGEDA
jgi:hypothetical protein